MLPLDIANHLLNDVVASIATSAMLWLVLYNVVFVSPMIAITAAVYFGLTTAEKAEAWRTRNLQMLHFFAGAILLVLGIKRTMLSRGGVADVLSLAPWCGRYGSDTCECHDDV